MGTESDDAAKDGTDEDGDSTAEGVMLLFSMDALLEERTTPPRQNVRWSRKNDSSAAEIKSNDDASATSTEQSEETDEKIAASATADVGDMHFSAAAMALSEATRAGCRGARAACTPPGFVEQARNENGLTKRDAALSLEARARDGERVACKRLRAWRGSLESMAVAS